MFICSLFSPLEVDQVDVAPLKFTGSACGRICFQIMQKSWSMYKCALSRLHVVFGQTCVCVCGGCCKKNMLRMLWVTVQSQTQSQNHLPHICSRLQPNKRLKNAAAKPACFTTSGATSFFPYAAAVAVLRRSKPVGPSQLGVRQTRSLCCKHTHTQQQQHPRPFLFFRSRAWY